MIEEKTVKTVPDSVPYIALESVEARLERVNRRLTVAAVLAIALTNIVWAFVVLNLIIKQ